MILRVLASLIVVAAVAAACTDSRVDQPSADVPVTELVEPPQFVPAQGSLRALVGMPFEPSPWLPPELGGDQPNPLGGASILNAQAEATVDRLAMHWFIDDDHANFSVSERAATDTESDAATWIPVTTWRLELGPDMVVAVGTNVCMPPVHTYDWQHGEFIAVTNQAQNEALGAWTMTATGPTPYADLDTLICERFVP